MMTTESKEIIGSYAINSDAQVSVHAGSAVDFTEMKINQLCALSALIADDSFVRKSDEIQSNAHWLVMTMVRELVHLIPMVDADARRSEPAPTARKPASGVKNG